MTCAHSRERLRGHAALVGLALLAGAAHLPALTGGLVWDDVQIVAERQVARSVAAALGAFARYRPWRTHGANTPRPRPLRDLLLAADHVVWGRRPFGYHLTNWLLHVAVGCAAFALLARLTGSRPAAWVAAAVFCVHPALVETVAQLKNRGDLAAAIACLASLHLVLRGEGRGRWLAGSVAVFALGLLCAEWPVAAPVAFMLALAALGRGRCAVRFLPHLVLAAAFALCLARGSASGSTGMAEAARQAASNLLSYAALAAMLDRLSPASVTGAAGAAAAVAAMLALVVRAVAGPAQVRRRVLAGALWAVAAIAPVCLITPQVSGRVLAQHRFYFACLGASLALAGFAGIGVRLGRARAAVVLVLIVASAARASSLHFDWATSRGLWTAYTLDRPRAAESRLEVATAYAHAGRFLAAERELLRAISWARCKPAAWSHRGPGLLHNLGLVYLKQGKPSAALPRLEEAARLGETSTIANGLGLAYQSARRLADAVKAYTRAIKLDPGNAEAHHNLGNCYSELAHDAMAAARHYREAIRIDPGRALSQMALGRIYYQARELDAAARCFQAARRGPTAADAHAMLGLIALEQGRTSDAEQHLRTALAANRMSWYVHLLAAEIAEDAGDPAAALRSYRRVLQLRPHSPAVRERVQELARELEKGKP